MSANNWQVCPRCKAKREAKRSQAVQHAAEQYGQVSLKAYEKLASKADEIPELEETFREDYQIAMQPDGKFFVSYHGSCQQCGFEHRFKHEEQLEAPNE